MLIYAMSEVEFRVLYGTELQEALPRISYSYNAWVSCQIPCSPSRPLTQHCDLMSRHATTRNILSLHVTNKPTLSTLSVALTGNIPPRIPPTPRVKRNKVRDEIWQSRTIVAPMRRAAAVVAAHHHILVSNDFGAVTRGFERQPDT
jgi:hypothetical protein